MHPYGRTKSPFAALRGGGGLAHAHPNNKIRGPLLFDILHIIQVAAFLSTEMLYLMTLPGSRSTGYRCSILATSGLPMHFLNVSEGVLT